MKIAMMGHKRIPSREGGIEIVVEELSIRMVEKGHTVTCFNRSGHHVSGKKYDAEKTNDLKGVKVLYVPTIDKKGLAALTSSFFASVMCAFGRYDIVHIHAEGPSFFAFIPKLFGKKVIVTVHGLDWQRAKWKSGFGAKFIRAGERNAVRFADRIIVLSHGVQQYFKETYGRDTVFIPNGVTVEDACDPECIKMYGLEKDGYILYVGRIVPEKCAIELVEAFKDVKTDKKLIIVGGSSDSADYAAEVQKAANEDERIILPGFIDDKTILANLYHNAYLYVLPSTLEGMPLTLLEAMSHGCACLTSDIRECVDVLRKHGDTFRTGDVEELRRKLQEICDKEEKVNEMKKGIKEHTEKHFSWGSAVDATLKVYAEVAGEGITGK